ncbi:hypothetical protein [Streptomyces sp. NPDC002187]|uniref:hypothetical protein n=1 Tax=Streptomyces sp. NPDC002187 TaxID=3364637 RepID=UPI0036A3C6A6
MRDHVDVSTGSWLRRWSAGDVQAVLTAFADPGKRYDVELHARLATDADPGRTHP